VVADGGKVRGGRRWIEKARRDGNPDGLNSAAEDFLQPSTPQAGM